MKRWLTAAGIVTGIILVLWLCGWDWVAVLSGFGELVIAGILLLLVYLTFTDKDTPDIGGDGAY